MQLTQKRLCIQEFGLAEIAVGNRRSPAGFGFDLNALLDDGVDSSAQIKAKQHRPDSRYDYASKHVLTHSMRHISSSTSVCCIPSSLFLCCSLGGSSRTTSKDHATGHSLKPVSKRSHTVNGASEIHHDHAFPQAQSLPEVSQTVSLAPFMWSAQYLYHCHVSMKADLLWLFSLCHTKFNSHTG